MAEDKAVTGAGVNTGAGNEGGEAKPPEKVVKPPEEVVIPVRRSVEQHIIGRQKDTIDKLRTGKEAEGGSTGEEEEDDSLTKEAREAVQKVVSEGMKPISDTLRTNTDEAELQTLFTDEPESKNHEATIRKYMKSEHWANVPISAIFHHVAFGQASGQAGEQRSVADAEADQHTGGGTALRPAEKGNLGNMPSAEAQNAMTPEEFEAFTQEVKEGKYLTE